MRSLDTPGALRGGPERLGQLRAVGTTFLRQRPLVVAPMMAASLGLMAWSGVSRRQLGVLAIGFFIMLSFFAYEAWRGRRRLVRAEQLFGSLAFTIAGLTAACAATGGLGSPFLPMLFAPTVIAFAAFGRERGPWALGGLSAALISLLLLPSGFPFPAIPAAADRPLSALSVLCAGVLLWIGVTALTDAYATARHALGRAGESVVRAAESRSKALEEMGAAVAHEIRNPLTAIRGLVELLISRPDPLRTSQRLDVVRTEVERVETILNGYLSFSRPWGELARAPTDVAALMSEVVSLLEARAEQAQITLVTDGRALEIALDAQRLKEALLNLALNALQATPGGGRVRLTWARDAEGATFAVEDTGPGLDAATLERLGQAFFTTRQGGTGLGVLLARQVAEMHGGTLTFSSVPGRGTRAVLVIPEASS